MKKYLIIDSVKAPDFTFISFSFILSYYIILFILFIISLFIYSYFIDDVLRHGVRKVT